jgi:predicted DNA-binding transcriptional regulator YafY
VGRGALSSRLARLERLKGLLKAGEQTTAREMAAELGVGVRTIHRDLDLLRNEGLPIEADRGRGGGIRLARRWTLGRINLDPEEAVDLLLSIAIAERMNSALLLGRLRSVRQKLAASFSVIHQDRIRMLRGRVLVGTPASGGVVESYRRAPSDALHAVKRAFFEMRKLRLDYIDEAGRVTRREIEPQFLYLNAPAWYLLAWDDLRNDVRFFRIDRIRSANVMAAEFRPRDRRLFLARAEMTSESI